jgi:hypothetical protein
MTAPQNEFEAILVVEFSLFRIGQDFVCLRYLWATLVRDEIKVQQHKAAANKSYEPLNFSEAFGLSLFLSGCHFRAAFR